MDAPFIWIVENLVKEKSYLALTEEIERQGIPIHKINSDFYKNNLTFIKNARVMTNGSIEICKLIKLHLSDCAPVTYSTFENYLCSTYYPYFEPYLFNDNYIMAPLESINRRKWWFYSLMGKDSTMFVRPDGGDKEFKADLIDIEDWDSFYESCADIKNSLAVVSSPKNIIGEWRFVVTQHKEILAVSSYRFQGLVTKVPSAPVGATEFVKEILEVGYYPDPVFCIDVVMDSDSRFWLMELTSFSSAGLYACKMENIVRRVKEIVVES